MLATAFSSSIKIENITIDDLRPKPRDPKYNKLLPRYYFPVKFTGDFSPISAATANCLRRTICGEMLVKALAAEYDDIKTSDVFVLPEIVLSRLAMIPLDQSCPIDTIFELNAENATATTRDVSTNEFKIVKHGKGPQMKHIPFNDTTTFLTLQPGKSIQISNIRVNQSYSYVKEHGAYCVGINTSSTVAPHDKVNIPIDTFDPASQGISSSVADPRDWRISFTTNGTMTPYDIIAAACDNIIHRLTSLIELLPTISNIGTDDKGQTEYMLVVPGESDSIGNIIMQTISDLYPDIDAVTYSTAQLERSCTIRIRCADNIEDILRNTVARLTELFKNIKKKFV